MAVRITDLTTASTIEADDYVVIDGATEGTRKVLATDMGGGDNMIDFTTTLTPSIDARGVSYSQFAITPTNATDLSIANAGRITAYLEGTGGNAGYVYPLITSFVNKSSSLFSVQFKSIYSSVQSTTSTTVSGTLHVVAPFEISSVSASM